MTIIGSSLISLATPSPLSQRKRATPPRTVSLPIAHRDYNDDDERAKEKRPPFSTGKLVRNAAWKRMALFTPQNSFEESDGITGSSCIGDDELWLTRHQQRRVPRCLVGVTVTAFLLAALLGLSTNLHAILKSSSLQNFVLSASLSPLYLDRAKPIQQRVLFQGYHEQIPIKTANNTATQRPKLYFHIGPHKVASTTLQTEMTKYQDRLVQDNIVYLGRFYHPYMSPTEHRLILNRRDDSSIQTAARDMFSNCWSNHTRDCVEDLHQLLLNKFDRRPYQDLPNLLISDEAFLKRWDDTNITTNRHYELLQEVLGRDWDIVIVLAYRRFYEWLPSNKHQADKTRTLQCDWNSKQLEPLFPLAKNDTDADLLATRTQSMLAFWSREHFFSESTFHTLQKLAARYTNFSFKTYHLYGKLSVRTNFLCNVLDDAHYSCRASRKQDAVATEERINTREVNAPADSSIRFESYPSAFFDALAMAARPSIGKRTAWERSAVAEMLRQQYYRGTMAWWEQQHPQQEEGEEAGDTTSTEAAIEADDVKKDYTTIPLPEPFSNPWEIPLICPTEPQLQQLLLLSLETESRYLPKLFRKSSAEHRASFYANSKTAYCWVDVDAFLSSTEWQNFMVETFSVDPGTVTAIEAARKS